MSSSVDIFEERATLLKERKKDIFEERADLLEEAQPPEQPSTLKDIIKQSALGAAKGLFGSYGNILDLLNLQSTEKLAPGHRALLKAQAEAPEHLQPFFDMDDDILPRYTRLPSGRDVEELVEILGGETTPQTRGGRFAHRIGEAIGAGGALGASPGTLGALGLGATAGQVAEEAGASPTTSTLVELLGTLGTGLVKGKVLPSTKKGKELAAAGRALGLTEKELSPLIKGKKSFAVGAKLARKSDKLAKLSKSIETKLGDSYKFVKDAAKSEGRLPGEESGKLIGKLTKELGELLKTHRPSPAKSTAIKILKDTLKDMRIKGSTYEGLINSYQDINQYPKKVRNLLEGVKKTYTRELAKASPQLAKDFQKTNQLYSQFMGRIGKLKPELVDKIINKAEALGIAGGMVGALMGYPWALKAVLGEAALRSLSTQYLTNPFLQNLPNKFIKAISTNDKKTAIALTNSLKKFLNKKYKDDFKEEDLIELGEEIPRSP